VRLHAATRVLRNVLESAAAAAALALVLTGCSGTEPAPPSAGPATSSASPSPGGPAPASSHGPATSSPAPTSSPRPPAASSAPDGPSASLDDGTHYVVIDEADAAGNLVVDKVDYRKAACDARPDAFASYRQAFEECFSNVNPLRRTVRLTPDADLLVYLEGDPPQRPAVATLPQFTSRESGRYRVWQLQVRGGRVTAVQDFPVTGS